MAEKRKRRNKTSGIPSKAAGGVTDAAADERDISIDFLEVHIPSMKEKIQNELEKKLFQFKNHFSRLTSGLRRFLSSR
jgi:hypothetical protein